ncbi:MAG: hypothetical protein QOG59_74, partial [Solirubrobacteraceae bacterium]|nr:hypothetical protein [Solirubrobacteraceae bacterium]
AGPSDLASHPSWILNDQNGNPILNQSQHHYLTDVGNPGYQQACVANAIATAKSGGFDGVFWDMINQSLVWTLPSGVTVPEYPTNAAWQAAMYSMLQYTGSQLHANGLLTIGNMGGAYLTPGLWQQWNGPLDGAEEESFTDSGSGLAAGVWAWPRILAEAAWSEANGKIAVLHSWNSTHAGNIYGLASMMLIAGGESSYATSNGCYSACETWYPEYATAQQLGAPLGPYTQLSGGVYSRLYHNGLVVVNPTASAIAPLVLGGGTYTGSGLTSVSSVSLAPTSGYILLRDPGSSGTPGPTGPGSPPPAPSPPPPPVATPASVSPAAPASSPGTPATGKPTGHPSGNRPPLDLQGIESALRRSLAGIQTFNPATPLLSLPCPRALSGPCAYRITLYSIAASSSGARKTRGAKVIGRGTATLRRGGTGKLKVRILAGSRWTLGHGRLLSLRITVALRYRGKVELFTVTRTVSLPRATAKHQRLTRASLR